jgi:hypothetical protein
MKKFALLAAVSALAVAGCAKKDAKATKAADAAPAAVEETKSDDSVKMPAGFPKMTASYKGVYTVNEGLGGRSQSMAMEIAGWKKIRSEMPHFNPNKAAAGQKMVMVIDDKTSRALAYVEGPDAPKIAVVIPMGESVFKNISNWGLEDGAPPKKVGSDVVVGINCDIWESGDDGAGATPEQACVSKEGILLWTKKKGSEQPSVIATSIDKGSVSDSRFAVPADAEIVDMGPCMKLAQEAMAAAQAGKAPDMAKMQECQAIGQKVSAVMGG